MKTSILIDLPRTGKLLAWVTIHSDGRLVKHVPREGTSGVSTVETTVDRLRAEYKDEALLERIQQAVVEATR
jgi:hypothetical protein